MNNTIIKPTSVCHVVGASPSARSIKPCLAPGDLCIAADGGWQTLKSLGVTPDLIVGDFDSSSVPQSGIETIRLNPAKDETDLYAAIQLGKACGYKNFLLYGVVGGSWGHSIGNLQILAGLAQEGFCASIIAEGIRVTALCNGNITVTANNGRIISIASHSEKAVDVTLKGMQYPLNNALLNNFFPLGVRNEIIDESANISVRQGVLLIFQENI